MFDAIQPFELTTENTEYTESEPNRVQLGAGVLNH